MCFSIKNTWILCLSPFLFSTVANRSSWSRLLLMVPHAAAKTKWARVVGVVLVEKQAGSPQSSTSQSRPPITPGRDLSSRLYIEKNYFF